MSVYKEEMYEFEELMKFSHNPRRNAFFSNIDGFESNNPAHTEKLNELREWMENMSELRISKHRVDGIAIDEFFIGFEQDGCWYNGVTLTVITKQTGYPGQKRIRLEMKNAVVLSNCYDKYRLNKKI